MSPTIPIPNKNWRHAAKHLARADATLAGIIRDVGPCTLTGRRDYFASLCRAILGQQISTAVAKILFERFSALFRSGRPTPAALLRILRRDGQTLRRCGVSRPKAAYLRDLASHFGDGRFPTRRLKCMSDQEIIACLCDIRGVGKWTAEMFLIFVLNRPDVLPTDDLGLRRGVQRAYKLPQLPTAHELTLLAESWSPYRTIGTWYIWRGPARAAWQSPTAT